MPERPPLPTLLSQLLVAFTIELDNEFEHRMPHRTTRGQRSGGPWLVSQAMGVNLMRRLGPQGLTLREAAGAIAMTNLGGMLRWGYVRVGPDPDDPRRPAPRADWVLHATGHGRRAQETWAPLGRMVESRWVDRFGAHDMAALRSALQRLLAGLGEDLTHHLPPYLPVVTNEMFSVVHPLPPLPPTASPDDATNEGPDSDDISALISRVLLAFTLEVEQPRRLALPIGANVLRVLDGTPVRVSILPVLTGVSKEAVSMSLTVLQRHDLAITGPDPSGARGQAVHLSPKGLQARDRMAARIEAVELGWRERLGAEVVTALRTAVEAIRQAREGTRLRLAEGLRPYPDGWRSRPPYLAQTTRLLADPLAALPHHPMVLHRGGWPDGS